MLDLKLDPLLLIGVKLALMCLSADRALGIHSLFIITVTGAIVYPS